MPKVAEKLTQMGLVLPAALQPPAGLVLPFAWVNVRGATVYVSGHGPQNEDGSIAGPFGQVGGEVSLNDAVDLARKSAVSMLASLQRELGDLDREFNLGGLHSPLNAIANDEGNHVFSIV